MTWHEVKFWLMERICHGRVMAVTGNLQSPVMVGGMGNTSEVGNFSVKEGPGELWDAGLESCYFLPVW